MVTAALGRVIPRSAVYTRVVSAVDWQMRRTMLRADRGPLADHTVTAGSGHLLAN